MLTGASAVAATKSTNYEQIRGLEYSLLFVNQQGPDQTGGPVKTPSTSTGERLPWFSRFAQADQASASSQTSYSAVYGTGWLFDYGLNSATGEWTGYFATNLHVADALMRADDNSGYAYNGADGDEKTIEFFLGKYDDSDGPLASSPDQITYVQLKSLPKTQWAATNFYAGSSKTYADFAVLAVTVDPMAGGDESALYQQWISPSVQELNTLTGGQGAQSGDYANLFATDETGLSGQDAFVAGYPAMDVNAADVRYRTGANQFNFGTNGVWKVNVPTDDPKDVQGQPFDTADTSPWGKTNGGGQITHGGLYDAAQVSTFTLTYHGVTYQQNGLGAVIDDSNLGEGSSGSMVLNQGGNVMGIYFGTMQINGEGDESTYGIMQLLVVSQTLATAVTQATGDVVKPYDLIGGTANNASYRDSLGGASTWLFPQS